MKKTNGPTTEIYGTSPVQMWFRHNGIDARWYDRSPRGKVAACDQCKQWVPAHKWRLMVDDGLGPVRSKGHGKRNRWLCEDCGDAWIGDPEGACSE